MAYVEEVIPESGLPSPPGHTLFMVPENWNPSTSFGSHNIHQPASKGPDPSTATMRSLTPPATWKRRLLPSPPRKRRRQGESVNDTGHRKRMRPPARIAWIATAWSSHLQLIGDTSISFLKSGTSWMIKSSAWHKWISGWTCSLRHTPEHRQRNNVRPVRAPTRSLRDGGTPRSRTSSSAQRFPHV
jgi:hypothetical protein